MNAPVRLAHGEIANPSFIRELCIALAHRWKPERLFVIFSAHVDESDSHSQASALTMAAVIGSARQWELFLRRLRQMKREYGFEVFHATEIRRRSGEFEGWSQDKCGQLVHDLAEALGDELTEGVAVTLPYELYRQYLDAPFPAKCPRYSQWGVCFRMCLERLSERILALKGTNPLHIVVEDGHRNAGAARTIFAEKVDELETLGIAFPGSVTYATKSQNELLMLADLQAHLFKLSADRVREGNAGYFELLQARPARSNAVLSTMEPTPESLQAIKNRFVQNKELKMARYFKKKASFEVLKEAGK
jgi:hypothetical protein